MLSPDGSMLLSRSGNRIQSRDLTEFECKYSLDMGEAARGAMTLNGDGCFLFMVGQERDVRVWDTHSGHQIRTWLAHDTTIGKMLLTPDDRFLVTASWDMTLKVWELDWEYQFESSNS